MDYWIFQGQSISFLEFGFSFFNGISTFMGYVMPKPSLQKNNVDFDFDLSFSDFGSSFFV